MSLTNIISLTPSYHTRNFLYGLDNLSPVLIIKQLLNRIDYG